MLWKKKYGYLSVVAAYFKLVPVAVTVKIIRNLVGSALPTLNMLMVAAFIDSAIATIGGEGDIGSIFLPLCVIVSIMLVNYYIEILMGMLNTRAQNKIKKIVAPAVAEKMAAVKFRYYENQESVDMINRAMGGFEGNLQGFFDQIFGAWNLIAQIIGFVVVLGMQLWWASLVFAVTCAPSVFISYKFGKKRYDTDKEMTKIDRKVGYIGGILTGRDTIEERYVYGYTKKMDEQYKSKYEFSRIERKKVERKMWINTKATGMLAFVSGAVVISILLPMAIFPDASGEIKLSIGMFTAIVNAVFGLSMQMQWSLSWQIGDFKYKFEYLKDLNKFLEFETEEDAACLPGREAPALNSIEFANVSFRYPGTEPYILKNFSAKLQSGRHYAIVGVNGAGKTTLTKLLTGLYKEYEGEIKIDGKELREYSQPEMKALSAVVYQDFCRYPLDFYHNIAIGNANDMENREKVEEAVDTIGLAETVEKLPKKYETPITKIKEDGVDLSGGEWQKVALARLIVNPAPLKILDEPTAALDPVSECKVYEQFGEIVSQSRTGESRGITIFISHRLGSTKLADEIIVISEGQAAETGTFAELMAKGGIYAGMFASQAEWYASGKGGETHVL